MTKKKISPTPAERATSEDKLDKALADSFPASDPVSIETTLIPGSHPVAKKTPRKAKGKPRR